MKLLLLLPALAAAQVNWSVPPELQAGGYREEMQDGSLALSGPGPSGAMTQTVDAAPWRGERVRLRASMRVEGAGQAQLLLRVDRPAELGFYDNMGDRPVKSAEWTAVEIEGEVAPDARTIETGALSSGAATVRVKDIVFEKLPPVAEAAAAREAIARNYARVDEAYAAGDIDAIASLAAPDAQVVLPGGAIPLATALTQIMERHAKGVVFRSRSTVTAARVAGGSATVWVNNESLSGAQGVLSSNRDEWRQTAGGWRLQRSTLIAARPVTPPDVLAEIRERAGLPQFQGVRLILWMGEPRREIPGFTVVRADSDRRAASETALAWLRARAPEEAGPAELAFQGSDASRVAAVVKAFDEHREATPEWAAARHAAAVVYQSLTMSAAEAAAANVIWLASDAYRSARILVPVADPAVIAPAVRRRYGAQVYVVGAVPRELLGGELFLDIATAPAGTPLGRWLAAQKFPYDGLCGR